MHILKMKKVFLIFALLLAVALPQQVFASSSEESGEINPSEIIFHHLGDGYGWEVPFSHTHRIPLPVIVRDCNGEWHCFSSSRVQHGETYEGFHISHGEDYSGKIVGYDAEGNIYRPLDLSITKNVLALFITVVLVLLLVLSVARWHKKHSLGANPDFKAPRKGVGMIELVIDFIYDGVIKPTLKEQAPKFAPYLLTVFMFILFMNLLGLIVIFPGGANLTGNIAVTMVLAVCTFFVTNIFGTKHYWKDILWPDVPMWLKFPLPIMPMIEIFGMFTKPAALTVRLFANMMGGHMIVISLTLLIFIFAKFDSAATLTASTVVSVLFSVFMLLLDVLVSFIQAYVFTMLSTLFISLAQEGGHEKHEGENHGAVIENK